MTQKYWKSSRQGKEVRWGMNERHSICRGMDVPLASLPAWSLSCFLTAQSRWSLLVLLWSCGLTKLISVTADKKSSTKLHYFLSYSTWIQTWENLRYMFMMCNETINWLYYHIIFCENCAYTPVWNRFVTAASKPDIHFPMILNWILHTVLYIK